MTRKGKEMAGKSFTGKRKLDTASENKGMAGRRGTKRPNVLQFFDVAAAVVEDDEEESEKEEEEHDPDFLDDIGAHIKAEQKSGKSQQLPFLPKEEDLSDEDLEELIKQRYRRGSEYVVYADETKEECDDTKFLMRQSEDPTIWKEDPTIWKVKCVVGHEREISFCLIQKYIDLQSFGTKLLIRSAFATDHVKGYVYIEADRECDVNEACRGLCSAYVGRVTLVSKNEVPHLLSAQRKSSEVSKGMWVRMKFGKYKGDLAQIVGVDDAQKRVTIKLIPRIDLQAVAKKLAGKVSVKQAAVPAPCLISSRELENLRAYIRVRHDRQTAETFQIIDGLMLKDGFLYKKVSVESLCLWDLRPSADELQRFRVPKKDTARDAAWLSALYGRERKSHPVKIDKMTDEALESASGTKKGKDYAVHDLVLLIQNSFGVIVSVENGSFQILKGNPERIEITTVELQEIEHRCSDKNFTALDLHINTVRLKDSVRVLEGPFKGRQGLVRHMYKGILFIHDDNQPVDCELFCSKSEWCEFIKHSHGGSEENDLESIPPGFEECTVTSTVPESRRGPWESKQSINERAVSSQQRGDGGRNLFIGQTLRIRVGPLKGYLCRVVDIHRSDVTVKLESQVKVITVSCEHLSEADAVGCRKSTRDYWQSCTTSGLLMESPGANFLNTFSSKECRETGKGTNSWDDKAAAMSSDPADCWMQASWDKTKVDGNQVDDWNKGAAGTGSWDKAAEPSTVSKAGTGDEDNCWKKAAEKEKGNFGSETGGWNTVADCLEKERAVAGNQSGSWDKTVDCWGKAKVASGNAADCQGKAAGGPNQAGGSWGCQEDCWNSGSDARHQDSGSDARHQENWAQPKSDSRGDLWDSSDKSKVATGDRSLSWDKAINCWDKAKVHSGDVEDCWGKAADSRNGAGGSWGSRADHLNNRTDGRPEDNWPQPKIKHDDRGGCWDSSDKSEVTTGDQSGSWDKAVDCSDKTKVDSGNMADCGGKAVDGWNGGGGSWGRSQADRSNNRLDRRREDNWAQPKVRGDDHGDRLDNLNKSEVVTGDQPGSWDKAVNCGVKSKVATGSKVDCWGKASDDQNGAGGSWASQGDHCNNGTDASKNLDNWAQHKVRCEDQGDQHWDRSTGSWDKANHGSGGGLAEVWNGAKDGSEGQAGGWRKPRFSNRGGRDGWNKEGFGRDWASSQEDGGALNRAGRGSRGRGRGRGRGRPDSWNAAKAFDGGNGGSPAEHWNRPKDAGDDQAGGWSKPRFGNQGGKDVWNKEKGFLQDGGPQNEASGSGDGLHSWGRAKDFGGDWSAWNGGGSGQAGNWNRGNVDKEVSRNRDPTGSWSRPKAFGAGQSSRWNKESAGNRDPADSWNKPKASEWSCTFSWNAGNSETKALDEDQSSSWDKGMNKQAGWSGANSGWNAEKTGNKDVGSGHRHAAENWNKAKASGEDRSSDCNAEFDGSQSSNWDRGTGKEAGWSGANPGWCNQDSGWNAKTSMNNVLDGDQPSSRDKGTNKETGWSGANSGWNKERAGDNDAGWGHRPQDNWNKSKVFGGDRGSGWNAGFDGHLSSSWDKGMDNEAGWISQNSSWNKETAGDKNVGREQRQQDDRNISKASRGDCGSDWNAGFDGDRSSSWDKGLGKGAGWSGPNSDSNDNSSGWNAGISTNKVLDEDPSFNRDKGTNKESCWSGSNSGWNKETAGDKDVGGHRRQDTRNKSEASGGDRASGLNAGFDGHQLSDWDKGTGTEAVLSSANFGKSDHASSWNAGKSANKVFDGNQSSNWDKGAHKEAGQSIENSCWNKPKASHGDVGSGWGAGTSANEAIDGDRSSDWEKRMGNDGGWGGARAAGWDGEVANEAGGSGAQPAESWGKGKVGGPDARGGW